LKLLSVELENFRNHENSLYEFDRGVNLILGHNGSGKSSIIEAIGLALFGGGLRDRQEDAIMWERNRARVSVTFLARRWEPVQSRKDIRQHLEPRAVAGRSARGQG
jgi:exonuclease SbcC